MLIKHQMKFSAPQRQQIFSPLPGMPFFRSASLYDSTVEKRKVGEECRA